MDNDLALACPATATGCELFRSKFWKSHVAIQRQKQAPPLQHGYVAVKPHAQTTQLREQTIEDLPSGLTLRLEACGNGCRILIAGRALSAGDREIVFDAEGRAVRVGPAKR
jgi:hypothetical protein